MGVKDKSGNVIKFCIYLVVVVLVNVAGITLFFRLDLTANQIYSISEASKQVVSTLSEPLTVNVFFTKNLPAPHNNTEQYLQDLLEEYALAGNKYFNYTFYNVTAKEDLQQFINDISQKVISINTYRAKLNTTIYPSCAPINSLRRDQEREKDDSVYSNTVVTGETGKRMRMETVIHEKESNINIRYGLTFDGTWLWIEQETEIPTTNGNNQSRWCGDVCAAPCAKDWITSAMTLKQLT